MPQQEDTQLIKRGESVFYGTFLRYLWRNEKNGNCFFQISTKQKLLLKEQFSKKEIIRDSYSKKDISWYTLNCDAANFSVPFYEKKTPVRITGYFLNEKKSGYCWDFKITSIQEASQEETIAIEYLASDSFPSISYENAVTIVRYHGADVFSYIHEEGIANKIQKESGLSAQQVKNMLDCIGNTVEERTLYEKLGPLGIPYPFCVKAVKVYGTQAETRLSQNPHSYGGRLGLSFPQCDAIAKYYGFSLNYEGRLRRAVYETLKKIANNGNVYASQPVFYKNFYNILKTEYYSADYRPSAIDFFTYVKDILDLKKINEIESFVNKKLVNAEGRIVSNILRLTSVKGQEQPWEENLIQYAENVCHMNYGYQQRGAFPIMLRNRGLKVLIGGPGTGKTTTIKGIIYVYKKMFPDHKISLCAPTGRAAQRMAESTEMEAVTVHRLLDYRPYGDTNIHKDANNPIQADLIVVDEMSMMDIELFDIFLSAVKTGTTIIFVGDTNQLEAVGAGTILNDLLNMPEFLIDKCELTEVFRQKGGSPIIENAIRVCKGITDLRDCEDFQIFHTKCQEETRDKVVSLLRDLYNPDDPFETQVLCPARNGIAGINSLNQILQKELNPGKKGMQYGRTIYRPNDKVIMTVNNYDPDCCYYNGDIGVIEEITPGVVKVRIRGMIFQIKKSMLDDMDLAYGMTIHKSQGSEFANVIVVMPMDPHSMLVKNLFYTAITRAKKKVYIINEGSAMETAIKTDRSKSRQTTLMAQLMAQLKKVHE